MLSDDMLRFVFVYDARFADALVGVLTMGYYESFLEQISRNIELFPEIPFKFESPKSSGVRVIESRCGPECCNGRN